MQAREKERKKGKKKNRKEKSVHNTLERAEVYSEIIHWGQVGRLEVSSGALLVVSYGSNKCTKH